MVGIFRACCTVTLSMGLAACAVFDGPIVSSPYLAAYGLPHRNALIGQGGQVEVIGNPFTTPKNDVDLIVTNVLRTSHFGGPFKLSDQAVDGSPYRIVVAFNADRPPGSYSLCDREPATNGVDAEGKVHIQAAFCTGDRLLSSTKGRVYASDLSDPKFRKLISAIGFQLFPPVDERSGDRDGDFLS